MALASTSEINKWKLTDTKKKEPNNFLVVGKRNRGKSTIIVDIAKKLRKVYPKAVIFSATDECTSFYSQWFNPSFVYSSFDEGTLQRLLQVQKEACSTGTTLLKKTGLLLIIDDAGFDAAFLRCKALREMFFNGRHLQCSLIIGLQDIVSIGPNLRSQIDYTFLLQERIYQSRKRLHEIFGVYNTPKEFCSVMDAATKNYGCLVINNVTENPKEFVTWHRAEYPISHFAFGSKSYRAFVVKDTEEDSHSDGTEDIETEAVDDGASEQEYQVSEQGSRYSYQ